MVESISDKSRAKILDVLRGFALFGILIINAQSILAVKGSTPAFTTKLPVGERVLQDLILFFIESKFFTLFSLLFGIGFAIQIRSAERQGNRFIPRISRRMLALFLFGVFHIVFFWDGDILVIYAITGTILIFLKNISYQAIKRWVISLLAAPGILVLIIFSYTLLARLSSSGRISLAKSDESLASSFADNSATLTLLNNTFIGGIHERINSYLNLAPLLISRIPTVLAMFLIGLYLGRSNFYLEMESHINLIRRIRKYGLGIGMTLMGLILMATKFLPATSALVAIIEDQYFAGPIFSLGITATVVLFFLKNPSLKLFNYQSAVGKMALTNYIFQSILLTGLSYGWGYGLALKCNGFQVLVISILIYILQVVLSLAWLKIFSFGPLEWIWRMFTYWRVFPLIKREYN